MIQADNQNEALILDFFESLSRNDLAHVRELLHPEATWQPMAGSIPGAGAHHGRAGIVDEFLVPIRGMFEDGGPKLLIDSLISKGPLVVSETRGVGKFKNGNDYLNNYCWVFEIKDDLVHVIREYMDSHYVMSVV